MFTITIEDFKYKFDRGQFTYSETLPDTRDKDINEAIDEALCIINQDLYPLENDNKIGKKALLYLTAHYLTKILDSTDNDGQSDFVQSSRSVGAISESLLIPEWMQEDIFAMFTSTSYGIMFLNITKPYMDGAVYTVSGKTLP